MEKEKFPSRLRKNSEIGKRQQRQPAILNPHASFLLVFFAGTYLGMVHRSDQGHPATAVKPCMPPPLEIMRVSDNDREKQLSAKVRV
jgi:hypothetical protein